MNYQLGYIVQWPEFQQYEEIPGFWKHAFNTDCGHTFTVVIEKEWLDKKLKNKRK